VPAGSKRRSWWSCKGRHESYPSASEDLVKKAGETPEISLGWSLQEASE